MSYESSSPVTAASQSVPPDRRAPEEQPRWRRDFPIDWSEDDYISRRELVKFIVLTSGAFAVGQVWIALKSMLGTRAKPTEHMPVASLNEIAVGRSKTFEYPKGSTPRLLIRTGPQAFVAFDQQCTHLQCPVVPEVAKGKLHCPCHNGWFDLQTGRPLAGPPRRPLPRVVLELRDDIVYATGIEESAP